MSHESSIPMSIDKIDANWLSETLRAAGYEVDISTALVVPIGTGQMATSIRAELHYAKKTGDAPDSVVVKIASDDPQSRAAGARGAYLREVRYYELLDASVDVCTPHCFASVIDPTTNAFALVLEDMYPARQGDQIEGCTANQALIAAVNIAGLHAPRWCDGSLYDYDWLTPPADQRETAYAELQIVLTTLTEGFIDRYSADVDEQIAALLRRFAAELATWLGLGVERFSLTHADHRLDNLLFADRPDRPVTVVDWQTVGVRNPLADISYLLGTGLEPEARRDAERDIVAAYHTSLVERGVAGYSFDQCFDDYRQQSLHALLITILGSMMTVRTDRGDEMFMAMLHRSAQQIFDLDSPDFLVT